MTETALVDNLKTPGQLVRDAGDFHVLVAPTGATAQGAAGADLTATGDSGWDDVGFIHDSTIHAELGTCTGTTTTLDIVVEQAQDSSGTNAEVIGTFTQATDASDDTEAKLKTCVNLRYVRVSYTISGSTPVFPLTVTLRLPEDHYDTNYSGTFA